jgi:WW domain-containing oxidoreductase
MWPVQNVLMSLKLNFMGFVECIEEVGTKIRSGIGCEENRNHNVHWGANLTGKRCIITGGNTGIGFATSCRLIKQGADVFLACRDPERAELAAQQLRSLQPLPGHSLGNVQVEPLDLASLKSVRKFIKEIKRKCPCPNILICNAGIMAPPQRLETDDGLELQFQTNYLGHWLIAQELIKHQRQQRRLKMVVGTDINNNNNNNNNSKKKKIKTKMHNNNHDADRCSLHSMRVVMLSSLTHLGGDIDFTDLQAKKSYHPFKQYAATKLMTLLTAKELHRRFQLHSTATSGGNPADCAVAVHPGIVDTDLARTYFLNEVPRLLRPLVRPLFEWVLFPVCLKTPEAAAESLMYAATMPGVGGQYIVDCKPGKCSALADDEAVAGELWKVSEELTGVDGESWWRGARPEA